MGGGRGSAMRPCVVLCVALVCMLLLTEPALGAIYTVGGSAGWTFNVNNWPKGKTFRAGDVLVFKYAKSMHNVVAVNGKGYNRCRKTRGAKVYQSGSDKIRLRRGHNYFICSYAAHCQGGMKLHVYAF